MAQRSASLAEKLASRFTPDADIQEAVAIVDVTRSIRRFDSPREFASHLVEGSLLNVSVLASKALSVPCGEYMVWMTDAGHTMLVPTAERRASREVFEQNRDQYEVLTRDLMANWNRLERTLAEDANPPQNTQNLQQGNEGNEENLEEPEAGETDPERGQAGEFNTSIDMSTVDRPTIARAMEDRGYTVTSLASAVGVQPPAISRILRTPSETQGDPGGRNPSIGLASQICQVLRLDPTVAFPDIFSPQSQYEPRRQQGNSGSGSNPRNVQDKPANVQESIQILEAREVYDFLCEEISVKEIPFEAFWEHAFMPAVRQIRPTTNIVEFVDAVHKTLNEFQTSGDADPNNPANKAFKARQANNKAAAQAGKTPPPLPTTAPAAAGRVKGGNPLGGVFGKPAAAPAAAPTSGNTMGVDPKQYQAASDKMNTKLLPPIQQAFKQSMDKLKTDLEKVSLQTKSTDPKLAPHAWKIVSQFYNAVMKAGQAWKPTWNTQKPGAGNTYDQDFQKAAQSFQPAATAAPAATPAAGGGAVANTQGQAAAQPMARTTVPSQSGQQAIGDYDDVQDAEFSVRQAPGAAGGPRQQAIGGRRNNALTN